MSIPQWDPSNALLDDFNNTIDPSIAFAQQQQQQQTPQPPNNNVNFNQFQNTQLQQRLQNGMSRPSSASQFSPQYNPNSAIPAKRGLPDGFSASPRQGMSQQFNNFSNGLAGQQMTPQFQHLQNANANPNTPSPTLPQQGFNPALLQNESASSPSPFTPSVQGFPGRNMSPATVGMAGQMHMNGMHMNPAAHQQMNVNNGMANGNHRFAMTPQQMQAMAMQNHQMSQQDQADSARRLAEAKHQAMLKQAANMQNAGMNPQQAQQVGNPQLQNVRNAAQANFLRMQQTLLRPQNPDQFTRQATQLMVQNGKQFNPIFQCANRQFHGCHIFARVMALGGSKTINDNQNWATLAGQLGLTPDQYPTAGMELANYWSHNLLMYEQYVFRTLSQERAKTNAIIGAAQQPGGPQQQSPNQFPQPQQPGQQVNKQGSPPQQRLQEQQQHLQQVMQQRALQQAQMQNAQAQAPAMNQPPAMPQQQPQQGIMPPQSRMQAPPATPSHPPSVVRDQTPMSQHAPSARTSIEPSVKPEINARLQINGAGSVAGSPQVNHLQGPPGTAMSVSQMTPSRQMSVSSAQMPPKDAIIAQQGPPPEAAHPELSVEALQQRFYNYTYAGIPLDTPEFYPMMVALDEQKPNMPDLMDLRVVDVQALTCSLESRIPGEVRLALDTLTLLSSNDRVHMKLDDCEELVNAMIDCAEDLIDFLSNNAAEVSDVMELQSYEDLVKETKLEMASLQPVTLVGSEDYALDRAAEHLLCVISILQNFSFGDLDPAGFVADLIAGPKVMRMITTCLRQIGTRESVLRSSRNLVDFYKDLIIFLSNMSTFINIPGREEAACILQYLLAFAPVQAPRNDPSVKFYFTSFESSIHRFLPAAVDVLAKLLAREEPNARLMRAILTDTSIDPNFDTLATLYGMSVSPMPDAYMNLTSPKVRMRKPFLAQGLLAAELLLGFLPASEFATARQWLQSENGFVRRLFWLISQGIPLPPRQQGQVAHLEEESDVDHALARRATSLLKKLSIKARDPDMIVDTDNDVTKSAFLHFMKTSRLDAVDTKQLAVFLQHGL